MKYVLVCYCWLCWNTVLSQIIYKPIIYDACSKKFQVPDFLQIIDDDSLRVVCFSQTECSTIKLPQAGQYYADLHLLGGDQIPINITNDSIIVDTLFKTSFTQHAILSTPSSSTYQYCGIIADSILVSYYDNGNREMDGVFKNGFLVDTMRTYYYNGAIKTLTVPNGHPYKTLTVDYFENGQINELWNRKQKYHHSFYPNGQLKYKHTWGGKYTSDDYYPSGIRAAKDRPTKKVLYYENGKRAAQMNKSKIWTLDYFSTSKFWRQQKSYARYLYRSFDTTGTLELKVIFKDLWSHYNLLEVEPNPDSLQSRQIICYKKGLPSQKICYILDSKQVNPSYKLALYTRCQSKWVFQAYLDPTTAKKVLGPYKKSQKQFKRLYLDIDTLIN